MPFRSEVEIDAVTYSDQPKDQGPAPTGDFIEQGQIIDGTVSTVSEEWEVELQFWLKTRGHPDTACRERCAAGHIAWRIGGQSGVYGVFDGYTSRIWFGAEPFTDGDRQYFYIDIGDDWRDKIHWNEFVDRVYSHHLQYPARDQSGLKPAPEKTLVHQPDGGETTDVYEIETVFHGDELRCYVQLWRPEATQAVFVAATWEYDDGRYGKRGVLEQKVILADTGFAISLQDDTLTELRDRMDELREADLHGLELTTDETWPRE